MLDTVLWIVLIMMSIALAACLYRAIKGPTMSDRIMALDTFGVMMIGYVGAIMILQGTTAYVNVALVLGILAFLGSIALAKFIERGVVFDRDHRDLD